MSDLSLVSELDSWWMSLRPTTRLRLSRAPRQPVPAELIPEITDVSDFMPGAYSPGAEEPEFRLLPQVQHYISQRAAACECGSGMPVVECCA